MKKGVCTSRYKPPFWELKVISRQPLTNFVNLKSNTIMKKPLCKVTPSSQSIKRCNAK